MRLASVWLSGLLLAALCTSITAQSPEAKEPQANEMKGIPPRTSASEYSAQAKAGSITIGADFAGHSVPKPEGPLNTEEFVVVEVGFFSDPGAKVKLSITDFSLRINGKKNPLPSQPFETVTSSLKDPEWVPPNQDEAKPKSKTGLSTGGATDNTPVIVHVPLELRRAMAQYLRKAALPEGDRPLPQAGLIFFRYTSQIKNIHSLELVYSGPGGETTLTLQP